MNLDLTPANKGRYRLATYYLWIPLTRHKTKQEFRTAVYLRPSSYTWTVPDNQEISERCIITIVMLQNKPERSHWKNHGVGIRLVPPARSKTKLKFKFKSHILCSPLWRQYFYQFILIGNIFSVRPKNADKRT